MSTQRKPTTESLELAAVYVACHGAPEVVEQVARLLDYVEARTAQEIARWLPTQPSLPDAARLLAHGEWKSPVTNAPGRGGSGPERPLRGPT